jgi:hypothetical protein
MNKLIGSAMSIASAYYLGDTIGVGPTFAIMVMIAGYGLYTDS